MTKIIENCSNSKLIIEAIEKSWFYIFAFWGSAPSREIYEDQYLKRVALFAPERAQFNCVHYARLTQDNMEAKIEETIKYFKSLHLPCQWYTGPSTRPLDLGQHLQSHGFTHVVDMPCLAVELDAMNEDLPRPSSLEIKPVENNDALRDWIQTLTRGFNLKKSTGELLFDIESYHGFGKKTSRRSYVGYLNGEPVASSLLLMTSDVAGLFCVATVPEARRRGIGSAISLAPLIEAREIGYRVGVVHSSQMGLGVYHRMGFKEQCKIGVYTREK